MGTLDQVESFLQGLMERPAWLLMPRRLQPVQLASALTKQIEEHALRLADRIVVPSSYTLALSREDFQRVENVRPTLERELAEYVERFVAERELTLPEDPVVRIEADTSVPVGRITARSSFPREERAPAPSHRLRRLGADGDAPEEPRGSRPGIPTLMLLDGDGHVLRSYVLNRPSMTLGRRSNNEIPIPDLKVSRHHARFELIGRNYFLADLESTNGTRLNGQSISGRVPLHPGDIIEVGLQRLRYDISSSPQERGV